MGTLWDMFVFEHESKGLRVLKSIPGSEIFHKSAFTLEFHLLIYTFKIKMICVLFGFCLFLNLLVQIGMCNKHHHVLMAGQLIYRCLCHAAV